MEVGKYGKLIFPLGPSEVKINGEFTDVTIKLFADSAGKYSAVYYDKDDKELGVLATGNNFDDLDKNLQEATNSGTWQLKPRAPDAGRRRRTRRKSRARKSRRSRK